MKTFKEFIINLLRLSKIPDNLIQKLVSDSNIKKFKQAFTHQSKSIDVNYEVFETLGDTTLNKCVVWYFKRRYFDMTPGKLTLTKNQYVSTVRMAKYARELEYNYYIDVLEDDMKTKINVLEDVFEAFIGCMEFLLDEIQLHSGYSYAYNFVSVYIERYLPEISVNMNDLLDPISALKNLTDKHKINVVYSYTKRNIKNISYMETKIEYDGKIIGCAISRSKKDSKYNASKMAFNELNYKYNLL
jgi:dsRNA-specific ribonuclease